MHVAGATWSTSMSRSNKIVLITGASKGIGRRVADLLTSDGQTVYCASRSGQGGLNIQMDVTCEDSVRSAFEYVFNKHGRIDVLINNAGIASSTPIETCEFSEWDRIIRTNLSGAFLCSREAIRYFLRQDGGCIVNVSSIAGRLYSLTASEAYTCSKYGLIGLTRQLANRYGKHGIRVNAVCPSQTLTEMLVNGTSEMQRQQLSESNPLGRLADPMEVAEAIRFLTSDKCAYLNGAVIDINGGIV